MHHRPLHRRLRLFPRLVDRDVPTVSKRRRAIADDERIQLHKAMALLLVIVGYSRAGDQFISAPRCAQQLHPAADVNPRTEDGVVDQHLVHDPLQLAGMTKAFA
jgi:hypothetical protein